MSFESLLQETQDFDYLTVQPNGMIIGRFKNDTSFTESQEKEMFNNKYLKSLSYSNLGDCHGHDGKYHKS
jgi:hypothetical protein